MRLQNTDELFKSFFKSFSVDELSWTAADSADADNAVFRNTVPTIAPSFRSSPADIVDDCDSIFAKPITEHTHTICVIDLERLRKILISGKIGSNRSGKVAENF